MTTENHSSAERRSDAAASICQSAAALLRRLASHALVRIWGIEQRARSALRPLQRQSVLLLTLLPCLGLVVALWLYYSLLYSLDSASLPTARMLGDLLVPIGTALASVSVIAFSLSLFLQQSVSDLYSPQYFSAYSYSKSQKVVYVLVVAIVLGQLSYGFYLRALDDARIPHLLFGLVAAFFGTASVFSLLLGLYLYVARKTAPTEAILFLRTAATRYFRALHKQVLRATWLANFQNPGNREKTIAIVYSQLLPSSMDTLLRPIYALSEVTMRLSSRGDQVAARHGLAAFTAALCEYLSYRRTSSLALPSSTHFLAIESDSESLLNSAFEKLEEMGDGFLRSGQLESARSIVDSYDALALAANQIKFIDRPHDNPILYQITYYLKNYMDRAMRSNDNEVPFRAIETFVKIGEHSASRADATLMHTVAQNVASITVRGATSGAWFMSERCYMGQLRLLKSLFQWQGDARVCFDEILKQLFVLHRTPFSQAPTVISSDAGAMALRQPFVGLEQLLAWVMSEYHQRDASDREDLSCALVSFADPLYSHLRSICEKINLDSGYTDTIAELIVGAASTLTALERGGEKHRMAKYVDWFTCLPSWIGSATQVLKAPRGLEHAIDAACKITLLLIIQDSCSERVSTVMDTQFGIVRRALEQNTGGYGYYEPRLMLRICYCGALATKHGRRDLVAKACDLVATFERARQPESGETSAAPSLLTEFLRWRTDVEERHILLETAADIAARQVGVEHVDAFLADAWGYEVAGNRWTGYDLQHVGTRLELLDRLILALRRRVEMSTDT